jgi:cytochrome d ubiquinol oxidase subunit II
MAFLLMLVAIELYPTLLISTFDPKYNITIYNAASSEKSLGIMLTIAAIGTPLVIAYTVFVYNTFKGKVKMGVNFVNITVTNPCEENGECVFKMRT